MRFVVLSLMFVFGCYTEPLPCANPFGTTNGKRAIYLACDDGTGPCEIGNTCGCEWWQLNKEDLDKGWERVMWETACN